jgi:VWFA-related protein
MLPLGLMLLLSQAGVSPEAEVRTVNVTVTDEKGAAIEGLAPEDVALLENGVARDIISLKLDRRPLTLAFLLDTSEAFRQSYRLQVLDAVVRFLSDLPPGSRFAVWTTGDRPDKRIDFTDDKLAPAKSLQRVVPQGGSTLLDTILEAATDLKKHEGERTAMVVLSAAGPEFSSTYRERVVEKAPGKDLVFLSVLVNEGETGFENRANYDFVLDGLARKSGGFLETVVSSMGAERGLATALAALKGQYQLTYATLPDLKQRKLEVTVARPGARTRLPTPESKKKI